MLIPLNFGDKSVGTALIELKEKGNIDTPDKQYKSYNRGIVLSTTTGNPSGGDIMGKEVYFEEFKDSAQVEEDGKTYAFIALEDIRGVKSYE